MSSNYLILVMEEGRSGKTVSGTTVMSLDEFMRQPLVKGRGGSAAPEVVADRYGTDLYLTRVNVPGTTVRLKHIKPEDAVAAFGQYKGKSLAYVWLITDAEYGGPRLQKKAVKALEKL